MIKCSSFKKNKIRNADSIERKIKKNQEFKHLNKSERFEFGVRIWGTFYRKNLHRFANDYFGIKLKAFQKILLFTMGHTVNFIYLASRRQGKTWLTGVFCAIMATLYPGIKIIIASGTKEQGIQVLKKIEELQLNSSNLRREIKHLTTSSNNPYAIWHSGSTITAVASTDSARGQMAHIIIYDEYRMIKKHIIDTVLKKFRGSERMPKFYDKEKYINYPKERNKQVFLSSAYYKSHWMWEHLCGYLNNMLDDTKRYFCCGLPYQLSIKEGLLSKEQVLDDMSEEDFSQIVWSINISVLFKPIEPVCLRGVSLT